MSSDVSAPEPHIHIPTKALLAERGYGSVAHIPILFERSGRYAYEMNRYLRERALAEWPDDSCGIDGPAPRFLRPNSIKKHAYELLNLLKYIEHDKVRIDWRHLAYDPHLIEYRDAQITGAWARSARHPPTLTTVAPRLDTAIDFLLWASVRGYRSAFRAPGKSMVRAFHSETTTRPRSKTSRRHVAGHRPDPVDLRIPSKEELNEWIAAVLNRHGFTKALACETILKIAIRREEAAELTIDVIPDSESVWNVHGNYVVLRLTNGTKGGKARSVVAPIALVRELRQYITGRRQKSLAKWVLRNPGKAKTRRLFLGEYDGSPLSAKTIYDAWTTQRIYEGWSPHLARHTWACYEAFEAVRVAALQVELSVERLPVEMIQSAFDTTMSSRIQPQLGHVSLSTTRAYTRWLHSSITLPAAYSAWHEFLGIKCL